MTEASQQEEKHVTHADLDRAAEAAFSQELDAVAEEEETVEPAAEEEAETDEVEEETEEEPEEEEVQAVAEEEPKVKDEENSERSKLGRKVKTLEDQLSRLIGLVEQNKTPVVEDLDDEEGDAFITPENLPKYIEREAKKKEKEQTSYQQNYVANFSQIGKEDANFSEIWEEMLENHNSIVTGDPKADANINFYKAKAALLETRKPVNPVQGKGKTAKTRTNVPDKIQQKQVKPVKLDPIAAEFVKRQKITNDFVQKTLSK